MLIPLGLCCKDRGGIFPFFPECTQTAGKRHLVQIKEYTSLKQLRKYQNICGITMIQKDENRPYHQISPEVQAKEKTKSWLWNLQFMFVSLKK